MRSIQEARVEVQQAADIVTQLAEGRSERLADFESQLWSALLALGRAAVGLYLVVRAARPRASEYEHDGRHWLLGPCRDSELGTRFGKVRFERPTGVDASNRRAARDLPVDRELGLCGGFSLGTVTAMTRLCAQLAFANARQNFRETYEWAPSPRAVLRMVDAIGSEARNFLEQAPAPDGEGEILVIQVDAKGAPMLSPETCRRRSRPHEREEVSGRTARRASKRRWPKPKRRSVGKKAKNAKMAVLGVIYTLRRTKNGYEGPINKRVIGTFDSHEALFAWLRHEADKRGYGQKRTLFLADGSEHIWRGQLKHLAQAEVCIDWHHIVERLWDVGTCFHPEYSAELEAWAARQTTRLRRGAIGAILGELKQRLEGTPKTGPGNKFKRRRLCRAIDHFEEHRDRMRYAELRKDDLDIATGAVEGAARNVVGLRLDGPGMHWGRERAERVLHLRCILVNGMWQDFVRHLGQLPEIALAAQPAPATPHLAKAA
ncbi:MAG: hypothetical protein QM765_43710 [Myxococcales bacterium]